MGETLDASRQTWGPGKHLARAQTQNGMAPGGRDCGERNKNKAAPVQFGMRQEKLPLRTPVAPTAYDPAAKIQDVEIERPWLPVTPLSPSGTTFEALQQPQEHSRADGSAYSNNHVQIVRLATAAQRLSAIKWGACENVKTGIPEFRQSPAQGNNWLTPRTRNVCSKTNPDIIHYVLARMLPANSASNSCALAYT